MAEPRKMPEHDARPTLDEAVRRRETLYQAILGLEQAAARPAVAREDEWREAVAAALDELEHEIDGHIDVTERPGGLYTEIVERAPRLSHRIHVLRGEHPEMLQATRALRARLAAPEAPPVDEVRDEAQHVLGRLVKHRQQGADLLWEAYSLDTGGAE